MAGTRKPPLTDADRERIKQLHAQGESARSISRIMERHVTTITRTGRELGLAWDSSRTAAATEAQQASNQSRRAKLVSRLYDRADKIMDRLEADQFKLIGLDKEGYARTNIIEADAIPGAEERALTGMVVNLLAGAARMEAIDKAGQGSAEAKGILGRLEDSLSGVYAQLAHTGGTPTAESIKAELE